MDKVGRNDPCPCGSGKKHKKCCEPKAGHKKINAQVLSRGEGTQNLAAQTQRVSSSLFNRVTLPPRIQPQGPDQSQQSAQ